MVVNENTSFIDELLAETEAAERALELHQVDILLSEINNLESQIAKNFEQTEMEKSLLDDWTLRKNSKLQERINWISKKLERFMSEQDPQIRTIDLANGQLQIRKQKNTIQITDMDEFMKNDNLYQLGTMEPEQLKPNLNMIRAYINSTKRIPRGVRIVEGTEKFNIKTKKKKEKNHGSET